MRIGKKFSSLLLLSALVLTGCAAAPEPAPSTQTPTEEPTPEPVYLTAPLTGVEYLEGSNPYLLLPAVSAKIDNTYSGRPQLALNDADIVYVTRVEGGMTRLLPVWHSRMPEEVGPVRSVRPVDASIIDQYDGITLSFPFTRRNAPSRARLAILHTSESGTRSLPVTKLRSLSIAM